MADTGWGHPVRSRTFTSMNEALGDATVCSRFGADILPVDPGLKIGIGQDSQTGNYPINGLRHAPAGGTSGWFIWCGEGDPSEADDYFEPLHAGHLAERLPDVLPYLALAPGWRFLLAPGHEDVWFDASLLNGQ